MKEYEDIWLRLLGLIEANYDEDTFNEFFKPLTFYKFLDGYIYVIASQVYYQNRIQKFHLNKINDLLKSITTQNIKLQVILPNEVIETETEDINKEFRDKFEGNLNATYNFKNFVVGDSNRFAYMMAMKIADQPGMVANPFYIFGDVGLGKTHLMQAIGNYILNSDINKRILYIKADTFMSDFTKALSLSKRYPDIDAFENFNKKYQEIDVLLIDDIQILGKAKQTQQEFFKLFDYLFDRNKQIIITSDRPASELHEIMERLTSRFQLGLIVDIKVPNLNHRIEILKKKLSSEFDKVDGVPDDVLEFIATYFTTNIRELEGALKRAMYYCIVNNLDFTVETTQEALEALLKGKMASNKLNENNYDRILSVCSSYYSISLSDLVGKQRLAKYTTPRHIAMYLIKNMYNLPYKKIGEFFGGRDHSTVLTACEKIENEIKTNSQLKTAVENIRQKVEKNS